jgi:N-acetylmuramoyl-L-alanine amidase
MTPIARPSPNQEARPDGVTPDILLLHYTGMESGGAALERLCDPQAKVSAHYLIEEDGRVFALVPEERRAWHAGLASWGGESDINSRSIGIELVNPGHEFGYRAFPAVQIASLIRLSREILERWPIPSWRVLGHSDVAPLRKEDPGELFPWEQLAGEGIGLWTGEEKKDPRPLPALLAELGYGYLREDEAAVIRAFQRHWLPAHMTGQGDEATKRRAAALLAVKEARA